MESDSEMERLADRVRAIEALLLELPEVTGERIEAARQRIRKAKTDERFGEVRAKLAGDGPLDEPAESALTDLAYRLGKKGETAT
ncbi:hypothetical protein BH10PSE7_BH10PSE7_30630 [soil metagenome]